MPARRFLSLTVNARQISVEQGASVAAAILIAGGRRRSVAGHPRAPFCGMGICFECRAEIDGVGCERTCMVLCRDGMRVRTDV